MSEKLRPIVCFLLLVPANGVCQEPVHMQKGGDLPERILSFFAPLVIPKVFQDVHRLKEYIRSDEFSMVRTLRGDVWAVDRIFEESMEITWSNTYEALFISTFAVMNHRRVGIELPLVGDLFWFPLTSEFPAEFDDRVRNLPGRLYPDSPDSDQKDKDKLQHFFGSAFLQFVSESSDGSERVGDMVEFGEESFIVGGRSDKRDQRANHQGRSFGQALLSGRDALPSDFLLLVLAASSSHRTEPDHPVRWCGIGEAERVLEDR